MKRILLVGIGVASLALAGCAGSKEAQRDAEETVAGFESTKEGTVVSVEEDRITVRDVTAQGETIEFRRTSETDLVREDQPFSWTEISEGMPVRVSYDAEAGAEKATRVEILTGSEADSVKNKAGGGWSRPEGITRPRGEGGPPPADAPEGNGMQQDGIEGDGTQQDGLEGDGMQPDDLGGESDTTGHEGAMDSLETNE
jgi:hypothetical protein